jgi:YD repeat-containing protein
MMIRILLLCLAFLLFFIPHAHAVNTSECQQYGGKLRCVAPKSAVASLIWSYDCQSYPYCSNAEIHTEEHLKSYFTAKFLSTTGAISINWDSIDWNTEDNSADFIWDRCNIPNLTHMRIDYNHQLVSAQFVWIRAFYKYSDSEENPSVTCLGFSRQRQVLPALCPVGTIPTQNDITNMSTATPFMCSAPPPTGCTADALGNPCSITTGNKFQVETDWSQPNGLLSVKRTYNSLYAQEVIKPSTSQPWTHNYSLHLNIWRYDDEGQLTNALDGNQLSGLVWGSISRPDGKNTYISRLYNDSTIAGNTGWFIGRDQSAKLIRNMDGTWSYLQLKSGTEEIYNTAGRLIKIKYRGGQFVTLTYADVQVDSTTILTSMLTKVTDNFGRFIEYGYNSAGQISGVTLPNSQQISYGYDAQNRLVSVTRPGYGTKTYHYSENSSVAPSGNPYLLTGITDEKGVRYANFAYDNQNRGILTEHAGGTQKYTLVHSENSTQVTDPNGVVWTYNKQMVSGSPRVASSSRLGVSASDNQYDQGGNITQSIRFGRKTTYEYDL